jgi:hypothetical protein
MWREMVFEGVPFLLRCNDGTPVYVIPSPPLPFFKTGILMDWFRFCGYVLWCWFTVVINIEPLVSKICNVFSKVPTNRWEISDIFSIFWRY